MSSVNSSRPLTPNPIRIVVTPNTNSPPDKTTIDSSMSRRRTARNLPALHCQLPLPPAFPSNFTASTNSPNSLIPSYLMSSIIPSRPSSASGSEGSYPITPIDQIVHTPLTPPKLPRLFPPPPRTWARLNVQARKGDVSPLGTPTLPLTPYLLGPTGAGKPVLGRLQIPDAPTGDGTFLTAQPTPSPVALSPFDLGMKGYFPPGVSPTTLEGTTRPVPTRTTSSSSSELARTALLRSARPSAPRRFSQSLGAVAERVSGDPASPLARGPVLGSPLASPFVIHSEAVDGGYFRF